MGSDMVVALGRATAYGRTLLGHNCGRPEQECQRLRRTPGRSFAPGEKVSTGMIELPQARTTFTVLGSQADGMWGYHHGVNEMKVAAGYTQLRTRLSGTSSGLLQTDLVRMVLERATGARQGIDLVTDLLGRYGQGVASPTDGTDGAFLIADPHEAFVLETSGRYWVVQQVREVRAVSDACSIRQDWNRVAPGLATEAIERQWWPEDGSKLDFAGALMAPSPMVESAPRRWGRATYLLQEQNGHIDIPFLRRLLADHYETADETEATARPARRPLSICHHGAHPSGHRTASSLVAALDAAEDALPIAWCAFGPPCRSVYFPIFLAGALPETFEPGKLDLTSTQAPGAGEAVAAAQALAAVRDHVVRLQEQFDQQVAEFQIDALSLKRQGNLAELQRQATLFHQHTLESYERMRDDLLGNRRLVAPRSGGLQSANWTAHDIGA
jgi:secernin